MKDDLKLLMSKAKVDVDDILNKVREEYNIWLDFVMSKRNKFNTDLKLYNNQKLNSDKIWDTTVYNVHSALMARLYMSKPNISFEWTKIWMDFITDNINSAYKEDFEEEDMENIKYQRLWDALFYWVGIVAKTGWNWVEKETIFQNIDPRNWIPDPIGNYTTWNYRYTWFEKIISEVDLKQQWLWNEDLNPLNTTWVGAIWAKKNLDDDHIRGWVGNYTATDEWYSIYYHFTTINWVKVKIITWNDNTLLLNVNILKPIFKAEKKDNTLIEFPFSFTYYRPIRNDPFGRSVVDDTGDVQRTKAIIANLRLNKSKAELYPMYLYNTRLVKNKNDLSFWFNKLIWVNPLEWEPLNNAITPIQKDFRADNSYLIDDSLDKQVQKATSVWPSAQGSSPQRRETATTNSIVQNNVDVNMSFMSKIVNWGEKQIAKLWYRWLVENLMPWDKKVVKIYNWFTTVPNTLGIKDLITDDEYKITVKSSLDKTEQEQKDVNAFNMALPLLQSLNLPKPSLYNAYRDFLRNLWYDEKKIWVTIPQTPEEIDVEQDISLLQKWIQVTPDENTDVDTALLLIKRLQPSKVVDVYIATLLELKKTKDATAQAQAEAQAQQWQEQQMQQWLKSNSMSQAGSALQNMAQTFTK